MRTFGRFIRAIAAAGVVSILVAVAGCQVTRDLTTVELRHARCTPGEATECSCRDGRRGRQICTDAGTYEACDCGADAGEDAVDAGG